MKKLLPTIFITLVFNSIFWNCKAVKTLSETEFEQVVFYEVFPTFLDRVFFDRRLSPPPPPPTSEFFDKYENIDEAIEAYKKTEIYKQGIKNWERIKDSLNEDSSLIYIAISDSITSYEKEDKHELINHFKSKNIVVELNKNIPSGFKIDLNRLKAINKKIKFKYLSEFPSGREFWNTQYDFHIAAKMGFSGIIFDKSKSFGVLNGGFGIGILNGNGYRIFIRKNNKGKWIIDKIVSTWES
jgi:hypothetical protein